MSVLNLNHLFRPESIALIGASNKDGSLGSVVMKNLLEGGFNGSILPVNPKYKTVHGVFAYQDLATLPVIPALAIICTPAPTVPAIITQLGERGTRAAVVLSAGFHEKKDGATLEQLMLDAAKPFGLRILGPNCIGLLAPAIGLNASFAHTSSLKGNLALVSQSGALCTALLDWAKSRGIGFSYFISLGNGADVDFGDLLDYLGSDASTHGILLYVESIKNARKFISAARATSRNKPVIIIKSGRAREGARAATTHTGAMAGNDEVFDAAIRRAGMLRVFTIDDLFTAVETLARARPIKDDRLLILTNGGGPGVLATDNLVSRGGRLAQLSPATIEKLDKVLPPTWSRNNPVDIIGDGDAERYARSLKVLLDDSCCDAILVMLVPSAVVDNIKVARAVVEEIKSTDKPILTCWMGDEAVTKAREIFEAAGIPTYDTPDAAIKAFMQVVEYGRNQESLMETPPSAPEDFRVDNSRVRAIIKDALKNGAKVLTEPEAKNILSAYAIPSVDTRIAGTIDEAADHAEQLGYPVALKILSPEISHKSDVGGVLLNIDSPQVLRAAAEGLLTRIKNQYPDHTITGFTVQKMVTKPKDAQELIIGVSTDPVFGPIMLFGQGGTAVEVVKDTAVALPPLNMKLAKDLMSRTRICRVLSGYRDIPAVDLVAVQLTLVKLSQLVIDHPEITGLDINPLLADRKGVLALDARISIEATNLAGPERLAIRPYPQELEEVITIDTGQKILIRPIKPEDESAHQKMLKLTTPNDIYFRFMRAVSYFPHAQLARFTQIDYDREMAFIATTMTNDGAPETLAVIRAVNDANNEEAEFAIIVRTDMQGHGIGTRMMEKTIRYCKDRGTSRLVGQTLPDNQEMIKLSKKFHFETTVSLDNQVVLLKLELQKH